MKEIANQQHIRTGLRSHTCIVFTVWYHVAFSSLFHLFPISVIASSQIGAKICALSYETKLNIGKPYRFFAMG